MPRRSPLHRSSSPYCWCGLALGSASTPLGTTNASALYSAPTTAARWIYLPPRLRPAKLRLQPRGARTSASTPQLRPVLAPPCPQPRTVYQLLEELVVPAYFFSAGASSLVVFLILGEHMHDRLQGARDGHRPSWCPSAKGRGACWCWWHRRPCSPSTR